MAFSFNPFTKKLDITSAVGYTAENSANKSTDYSVVNNSTYPSTQATDNRYLDKSVTADDSNSDSAVYKNVPGWSFTVEANKTYSIDGIIRIDNTAAAAGTLIKILGPVGATLYVTFAGNNNGLTTSLLRNIVTIGVPTAAITPVSADYGYAHIRGTITIGVTAGTIVFQYAPQTNTQLTIIKRLGSFLSLKPIL